MTLEEMADRLGGFVAPDPRGKPAVWVWREHHGVWKRLAEVAVYGNRSGDTWFYDLDGVRHISTTLEELAALLWPEPKPEPRAFGDGRGFDWNRAVRELGNGNAIRRPLPCGTWKVITPLRDGGASVEYGSTPAAWGGLVSFRDVASNDWELVPCDD